MHLRALQLEDIHFEQHAYTNPLSAYDGDSLLAADEHRRFNLVIFIPKKKYLLIKTYKEINIKVYFDY